jgi:hypothetical protein
MRDAHFEFESKILMEEPNIWLFDFRVEVTPFLVVIKGFLIKVEDRES